jgi:hypothetical protein
MTLPTLVNLDHVEVSVEPWSWPFATARRADIDAHFADLRRRQTALWNGRALMLHSYAVDNGMLTATAFEADYASLCAWRDEAAVVRPYPAVTRHVRVNGGLYIFEPPAGGHRYTSAQRRPSPKP